MNDMRESNSLHISWCDSQWLPVLSQHNVLDYFSERSNPFYDRTCNNEILKMQRASIEQLRQMEGIEYILLHCQEPILYVIRKQQRLSPSQATPISDYYIIAGVVYQAPDLNALINSRILTTVHHLQSAFEESYSYSRYHPSKGYWFEFSKDGDKETNKDKTEKTSKDKTKEEMSSSTKFQRKRVDILLSELTKKFPPKLIQQTIQQSVVSQPQTQTNDKTTTNTGSAAEPEPKVEIKQEKPDTSAVPQSPRPSPLVNSGSFRSIGGPPEKRQRLN